MPQSWVSNIAKVTKRILFSVAFFLGPYWAWWKHLAPNYSFGSKCAYQTQDQWKGCKRNIRERQDLALDTPARARLGKTIVIGLGGPDIMSRAWQSRNDSSNTSLQQPRAAAGAHLQRNITMKNGEWLMLMSQTDNKAFTIGNPITSIKLMRSRLTGVVEVAATKAETQSW